jgi:hypothetical protein
MALPHRWPTAAAFAAFSGALFVIVSLDREVDFFGPLVVAMAGIYLMAYALGPGWTVWIALAVLSTVFAGYVRPNRTNGR